MAAVLGLAEAFGTATEFSVIAQASHDLKIEAERLMAEIARIDAIAA